MPMPIALLATLIALPIHLGTITPEGLRVKVKVKVPKAKVKVAKVRVRVKVKVKVKVRRVSVVV